MTTENTNGIGLQSPQRLSVKDLRIMARTMGKDQVRFLVDRYYQMQKERIAMGNMARISKEDGESADLLEWLAVQQDMLEDGIRRFLAYYIQDDPVADWLMSIRGIGPVLASGLIAHIDIRKAPTAGHIWNFAGLNPGVIWERGKKRPFNAKLKTLCWKIGKSFVMTSGSDLSQYGPVYRERKAQEIAKNLAGEFAAQAAAQLASKKIRSPELRGTLESGALSDAHLDERARRATVKLFLSHLHSVWHWLEFGEHAPRPYVLEHLGHAHMIEPPNPPWVK